MRSFFCRPRIAGRGDDLQEQSVLRRSAKRDRVREEHNTGHSDQHRARLRVHRNRNSRCV